MIWIIMTLLLGFSPRSIEEAQEPLTVKLEYRWSEKGFLETASLRKKLATSREVPDSITPPDRPEGVLYFARWSCDRLPGNGLTLAVALDPEHREAGRLYLDQNGDGDLRDEVPLVPRTVGPAWIWFGQVPLTFKDPDGSEPYHLDLHFYGYPGREAIHVGSAGWLEGGFTPPGEADETLRLRLVDFDVDGRYDTPGRGDLCRDQLVLIRGEHRDYVPLSSFVLFGDVFYRSTLAPGRSLLFQDLNALDLGVIQGPEDLTKIHLISRRGSLSLEAEGGRVKVPEGEWRLRSWTRIRHDRQGTPWRVTGIFEGEGGDTFTVEANRTVRIAAGDPLTADLSIRRTPQGYAFRESVRGAGDERIRTTYGSPISTAPPAPKLLVTGPDGEHLGLLTFAYG